MTCLDSIFICTLCLSSLSLVLSFDSEPPSTSLLTKAQLIQNPYMVGEDFYAEMPREYEPMWKRVPLAGFHGMRGKKAPTPNFYGMRGKKGPVGFLGMRGKKMDPKRLTNEEDFNDSWNSKEIQTVTDQNTTGDKDILMEDQEWFTNKRAPAPGFMGLRGKRSSITNNIQQSKYQHQLNPSN